MDNKPILFEDKMKYRDNEFLYDKCIKQHDCIKNYQWKMREYKDRINKAIEYINYCLEENCEDSGDYLDNTHIGEKLISMLRGEDNG